MNSNRRSHRLTGYDYSRNGAYFITIVSQDRVDRFGEIVNGVMVLNDAGKMVQSVWCDLPVRFPMIQSDSFVVMPNHVHGIIHIVGTPLVGVRNSDDLNNRQAQGQSLRGVHDICPTDDLNNGQVEGRSLRIISLGDIIGAFKSITTHRYINGVKMGLVPPFRKRLWQHRFYDHIIRNENEHFAIRKYIQNNPQARKGD